MRRIFLPAMVLVTAAALALAATGCRDVKPPEAKGRDASVSAAEPEVNVPTDPAALKKAARNAIKRGVSYLIDQQRLSKDGIWDGQPGVTAVVLLAILRDQVGYNDREDPFVRGPVKYLLDLQKSDGSIYKDQLANYTTAIALQVLIATKNPAHADAIREARTYLIKNQLDEGEGYKPGDPDYGGLGYGSTRRPDLSNTQVTADALKAAEDAGLEPNSDAWKRMVVFMSRCQNRSESNDMKWAGDDGGVVYGTRATHSGTVKLADGREGLRSYGSMTYAFLKGMIYAKISPDDPRVKAAYEWLQKNYTLEENPGMGQQGLYYYYHTMAKALRAFGKDDLIDADGTRHDWRAELITTLLKRQRRDGAWANANDRWSEGLPNLVTAFAVLTLDEILADMP